jgi:CHAT domain-containing protein
LYNWLIRPIETVLQQEKVETLVFVLDGAFRSVPMAALSDGGQFLIEKYSIATTPG